MATQAGALAAFALPQSLAAAAAGTLPATAPAYEIVDLGDFGGELAHASAISDTGRVAGAAEDSPTLQPCLWESGSLVDLGYLTAEFQEGAANAISAIGGFIGGLSLAAFPAGDATHPPSVWTAESGMQDLLPPGSSKAAE